MKILTWNINGIRASKVPLKELFDDLDADVICIQETKVTRDQLDERTAILEGYNSYYSFSKGRSGYSGVATYVRDTGTPWKTEEGLSGGFRSDKEEENIGCYGDQSGFSDEELQSLDSEGRTIITQHRIMSDNGEAKWLTVINVYCPRADPEREERATFKQRFYQLLQIRAEALLESGSSVIVLGDVNTSHKRIDHCDPDNSEEFEQRPGRLFLDQFLWNSEVEQLMTEKAIKLQSRTGGKFVDTFRHFHPNERDVFTCWSTVTGARKTNYGTRIDYIFADQNLTKNGFKECVVLPDVQGSDHCPVKATLTWELMACKKCPSLCTKYFPEYTGKQQKLHTYFQKAKPGVGVSSHSQESRKENHGLSSSCKQPEDTSEKMQESNHQKQQSKRQGSAAQKGSVAKKMKKGDKQPSGGKQANLTSFFSSSNSSDKKNNSGTLQNTEKRNTIDITTSQTKRLDSGPIRTKNNEAINSWKKLLKGPAPAPLCDGHKEPCVLRTVKKEGPNLGKQFYVCSKPEGLKTNPDARCEYFEWVDKKRL